MFLDTNKKYLIIDKSGWDPFNFALSKKSKNALNINKIDEFFRKCHTTPLITKEAFEAGEFTDHSYNHNLFSGVITTTTSGINSNGIGTVSFNTDGTLTSNTLQFNNRVEIISITDVFSETISLHEQSKSLINNEGFLQYKKTQKTLWETSKYWGSVSKSMPDLSVVYTNRQFQKINLHYTTLVNDWHLREQIKIEGYEVCGSSSILANMVLANIINYQNGTCIYKIWGDSNKKWLPNKNNSTKEKYKFREILEIERKRIDNNRNFFLSK